MCVEVGNHRNAPAEERIKEEEEEERKRKKAKNRGCHGSMGLAEAKTKTKTRTRRSIAGEGLTWACMCFHLVYSGRRL